MVARWPRLRHWRFAANAFDNVALPPCARAVLCSEGLAAHYMTRDRIVREIVVDGRRLVRIALTYNGHFLCVDLLTGFVVEVVAGTHIFFANSSVAHHNRCLAAMLRELPALADAEGNDEDDDQKALDVYDAVSRRVMEVIAKVDPAAVAGELWRNRVASIQMGDYSRRLKWDETRRRRFLRYARRRLLEIDRKLGVAADR